MELACAILSPCAHPLCPAETERWSKSWMLLWRTRPAEPALGLSAVPDARNAASACSRLASLTPCGFNTGFERLTRASPNAPLASVSALASLSRDYLHSSPAIEAPACWLTIEGQNNASKSLRTTSRAQHSIPPPGLATCIQRARFPAEHSDRPSDRKVAWASVNSAFTGPPTSRSPPARWRSIPMIWNRSF